jgi:hypothetical protein
MRAHALTDLYVPARLGSPSELQFVAREAGLDVILRVAEDRAELPTPEELAALSPEGPAVLHAVAVSGPGFRFACLVPESSSAQPGLDSLESLESMGDALLVQSAIAQLGGLALPVAPRREGQGVVSRRAFTRAPGSKVGVVALTIPGSLLGRDLDLEDAVIAERPVLGGSGPFAHRLGRYATLLPVKVKNPRELTVSGLVESLSAGLGFAVEMLPRAPERVAIPDPLEGREDGEQPEKRRRRRRKRKG